MEHTHVEKIAPSSSPSRLILKKDTKNPTDVVHSAQHEEVVQAPEPDEKDNAKEEAHVPPSSEVDKEVSDSQEKVKVPIAENVAPLVAPSFLKHNFEASTSVQAQPS